MSHFCLTKPLFQTNSVSLQVILHFYANRGFLESSVSMFFRRIAMLYLVTQESEQTKDGSSYWSSISLNYFQIGFVSHGRIYHPNTLERVQNVLKKTYWRFLISPATLRILVVDDLTRLRFSNRLFYFKNSLTDSLSSLKMFLIQIPYYALFSHC